MRKNIILLIALLLFSFGCGNDNDEAPSADDCGGQVCMAVVGVDETSITVPSAIHGVFDMELTFAEPDSPVALGTKVTFTISANKLIVAYEGEDCFSIENPVARFGANNNYTFKAACIDDIAFNISQNTDGTLNEVNLELASGPGFYGQFTPVG